MSFVRTNLKFLDSEYLLVDDGGRTPSLLRYSVASLPALLLEEGVLPACVLDRLP
jgi:hypothetical protein